MTLDHFAALMEGLGYKAEKGEREKVRAAPEKPAEPKATDAATEAPAEDATSDAPAEEPAPAAEAEADAAEPAPVPEGEAAEGPEMEVFYTFTWGGNRPNRQGQGQGRARGKPQGKSAEGGRPRGQGPKGKGKGKGGKPEGARKFEARPPKKDKIDPDNPFAALAALKGKV